jgi:four helix bundle protein
VNGEKFDKIKFKKRIYTLVLKILKSLEKLPKDNVTYKLSDQLIRSSTSVIANYVEGQSAISKKEFISFLQIALKSVNESKLWLAMLKDMEKMKSNESEELLDEMNEISKVLTQSLITLKKSNIK